MATITRSTRAALAAALSAAATAAAFPILTPPPLAIEFHNDTTNHYVLLVDAAEIAGVEAGAAGPGWHRTGYAFEVGAPGDAVADGNVCRFYAPGPNSHFYTSDAAECAGLRADGRGWIFEKFEFRTLQPQHGQCEFMQQPVYRLYNNRWMHGDSNHRFTPDAAERARMVAAGWADEGVAFCTPRWSHAPLATFAITSGKLLPSVTHCEDEALNLGPCTGINQLPLMPNTVTSYLPPSWVVRNPEYPRIADEVTGLSGMHELHTAQPVADDAAVAWHSFVQTNGQGPLFGIHVNGFDRTLGDLASINPLYQFSTAAPAAGQPDRRVFPFRASAEARLEVGFELKVRMLVRADPQSHAYGHPTLEFIDRASGEHLYVTVGAYGSVVPEDFVMRDGFTGRVIVSTWFRPDPAFGRVLSGSWIACSGAGPCDQAPGGTAYRFAIDRAAFGRILQLARGADPALSANPDDYLLDNFHFNNEAVRDAAVGLRLDRIRLDLFGS